jgi:hypothetical protein
MRNASCRHIGGRGSGAQIDTFSATGGKDLPVAFENSRHLRPKPVDWFEMADGVDVAIFRDKPG